MNINVGKIAAAIEAGRTAAASIDHGPIVSSAINDNRELISDLHFQKANDTIFLMGVHNWGDLHHRVGK